MVGLAEEGGLCGWVRLTVYRYEGSGSIGGGFWLGG